MNRARAALCGLALCGLALAGCAPAVSTRAAVEASFAGCVGTMIETYVAMQAEFPGQGGSAYEYEALLHSLRKAQARPGLALAQELRQGRSVAETLVNTCEMANLSAAVLDAKRRGDKAEMCRLFAHYDGPMSHQTWSEVRAALAAC